MKQIIRLTEGDLHNIIRKSVNNIIQELDWKTTMNAARKRKEQADNLRGDYGKMFPNSRMSSSRNGYDDRSDELEKYSQDSFNRQYNLPLEHGDERDGWWNGEEAHIKHRRKGSGIPQMNGGYVYDETFDDAVGYGFDGSNHRKHTTRIDKDGAKYDPYLSTVGNEISKSRNKDYNDTLDNMIDDMDSYYGGRSKYKNGKWS